MAFSKLACQVLDLGKKRKYIKGLQTICEKNTFSKSVALFQ